MISPKKNFFFFKKLSRYLGFGNSNVMNFSGNGLKFKFQVSVFPHIN